MRIRDDWNALVSWRAYNSSISRADTVATKLSSGYRVNAAGDDVSGFAISQRLRTQFRGLVQATRNALDGLSMLDTAEGALTEIHVLLQRGRELAVSASNGTLTETDRSAIQTESDSILSEIDRVVDEASFNGRQLFNPSGNAAAVRSTVSGLRGGWLEQAEDIIRTYYGLIGDGSPLSVVLQSHGVDPAYVDGTKGPNGRLDNLALHINVADFGAIGGPDGGKGPIFNDRKVAKAITQAVLGRNTNFTSLDKWFISGASEFIAGRDEQLLADINVYGADAVIDTMNTALSGEWPSDSLHQSGAYLGMKYLNDQLDASGYTIKDVMERLSFGDSLDDALSGTLGMDVASFVSDFKAGAAGFLATLNLNNSDVGGINPGDARQVIPDGESFKDSPMKYLNVDWSRGIEGSGPLEIDLQIGVNAQDTLRVDLPELSTYNLGLVSVNLVDRPAAAIDLFTNAISSISRSRTDIGSAANRLQHILNVNGISTETSSSSLSRIVDVDYAQEITNLAKEQILVSSSGAMVAHSNTVREYVMTLLNGMNMVQTGDGKQS